MQVQNLNHTSNLHRGVQFQYYLASHYLPQVIHTQGVLQINDKRLDLLHSYTELKTYSQNHYTNMRSLACLFMLIKARYTNYQNKLPRKQPISYLWYCVNNLLFIAPNESEIMKVSGIKRNLCIVKKKTKLRNSLSCCTLIYLQTTVAQQTQSISLIQNIEIFK